MATIWKSSSTVRRRFRTGHSAAPLRLLPELNFELNFGHPTASPKGAANQMVGVSWRQSKSRGRLVGPAVAPFPQAASPTRRRALCPSDAPESSRSARWGDTRSSMQRFDASTMILTCPLQRSQVSMGPPEPLRHYALRVQVIATWRSARVLSSQFSPAG